MANGPRDSNARMCLSATYSLPRASTHAVALLHAPSAYHGADKGYQRHTWYDAACEPHAASSLLHTSRHVGLWLNLLGYARSATCFQNDTITLWMLEASECMQSGNACQVDKPNDAVDATSAARFRAGWQWRVGSAPHALRHEVTVMLKAEHSKNAQPG